MAWTARPSASQLKLTRDSRDQLAKLIADLNEVLTASLPAIYKVLSDNGLQPPAMKPIPPIKLAAIPGY